MHSWLSSFLGFLDRDTRLSGMVRISFSIALLLIFWQILTATFVTNKLLLVPPYEVLEALLKELRNGRFWTNATSTFIAIGVSFPIAVFLGVGIGLLLASSRIVSLTAGPILTAMYSVPIVALAPLFIAWLGLGLASKILIVVLIAIFPVIVTTEAGLRAADKPLIEAAKSFNANQWQLFSTVTFPYALPFIVSGIRVAWARCLVGIVVAEFFGSFAGFGFAILSAGQTFDTATLLAYVIVLGVMGLLGSLFFTALEKRLAPWRQE